MYAHFIPSKVRWLLACRRKSPAWFGLQRKHAELAVADVAYLDVMRDNCKARTMINHK